MVNLRHYCHSTNFMEDGMQRAGGWAALAEALIYVLVFL